MTLLAPDSLGCVYVDLSLLLDDRLVLSCKVVTLTFRLVLVVPSEVFVRAL